MKSELLSESPAILREFLGHMETILGKSRLTAEEYFIDLRTFFRWLKLFRGLVPADTAFEQIAVDDVGLDLIRTVTLLDVYEYMNYLATVRDNHAAARSRKVSSLRTFFHFLTSEKHYLQENPVRDLGTPKQKKSLPKYLTLDESLNLLKHAAEGENGRRDFCIVTLFLNCGLRLSELVGLNLTDIRDDGTMRVTGKGNKERTVYLNDACREAIQSYLQVRPVDGVKDKNALFLSRLKQRISPKTVQLLVKQHLSACGLGDYSVHKLRHTAATLMYQHGNVDVRTLQQILGHENLNTTQIYTHVSDSQLRAAADANPLSKVKPRKKAQIKAAPETQPVPETKIPPEDE